MADGIDPMDKRRADRAARVDTFEIVAREWLELQRRRLRRRPCRFLGRG